MDKIEINKNIIRPGGCNHYTICLHSTQDSPDHYRPPRTEIQLRQMVDREHGGRLSVHAGQAPQASHAGHSHQSKKCQDGSQPSKVSRNSILTLSIIVILYLVCNGPRLTLNTAEYLIRFNTFYLTRSGYSQTNIDKHDDLKRNI